MTLFWMLAAGLGGLAVSFVVAPLLRGRGDGDPAVVESDLNLVLRREQLAELAADLADGKLDQAQYDAARRDLEREALHDLDAGATAAAGPGRFGARAAMAGVAVAVPLAGLLLYQMLGAPDLIPLLQAPRTADQTATHGGSGDLPPLEELVARLEARMQQTPDDAEGWMMLGRTYYAMRNPVKAEAALAKAWALTPKDPQVLLVYAEVIAANNDNRLEGRPAELISQALALDPDNTTARWLAGMAAFQRGQYNAAATAWKKVLGQLDPASDDARELAGLIEEAEARAGLPASGTATAALAGDPAPTTSAGPAPQVEGSAAAAIEVSVELDPALAAQAPPEATVFVFARAVAGPPMPLAATRAKVADLPLKVRLDDGMAMLPQMRLSAFPEVMVGARVSLSGEANPRPGDLEGEVGPLPTQGTAPVTVRIGRVRP